MPIPFGQIRFGLSDARKETGIEDGSRLLLDGFFDPDQLIDRLLNSTVFLVLGRKGTGKSAIAQHLGLLAKQEANLFVRQVILDEAICKSIDQSSESEGFAVSWWWFFLTELLASVENDQGASYRSNPEAARCLSLLRAHGLVQADRISAPRSALAKLSLKITGPGGWGVTASREPAPTRDLKPAMLIDAVKGLLGSLRTTSKHLICVDGLDELFTRVEIPYHTLGSMITSVSNINDFLAVEVPACKILVACRTELFERLPSPNKNKIRADSSLTISWSATTSSLKDHPLARLANHRARVSDSTITDVFDDYFGLTRPGLIRWRVKDKSPISRVIELTRETPRDLVALMNAIKEECRIKNAALVDDDIFESAAHRYIQNYFFPEVLDELDGYLSPEQRAALMESIGAYRTQSIRSNLGGRNLVNHLKHSKGLENCDVESALRVLYDCGAIGMHIPQAAKGEQEVLRWVSDNPRRLFKYLNPYSVLVFDKLLCLHPALELALLGQRLERSQKI